MGIIWHQLTSLLTSIEIIWHLHWHQLISININWHQIDINWYQLISFDINCYQLTSHWHQLTSRIDIIWNHRFFFMRLLHLTIKFTYLIGKLSCAAIPSPETHFSDSHPSLCLGPLRIPLHLRIPPLIDSDFELSGGDSCPGIFLTGPPEAENFRIRIPPT